MAIVVGNDTRLVVQGITGSEGSFHAVRNRDYGTNVVAGVTPGKGGQDVVRDPGVQHGRGRGRRDRREHDARLRPGPIRGRCDLRGRGRGIETVICVAEGLARTRCCDLQLHPAEGDHDARAELPGRALAGQGERGDHPGGGAERGPDRPRQPLGDAHVPDRLRARAAGLGNSTIVGIGGDPVVGSSFIDVLGVRDRRRDRRRRHGRRDRRRRGGEGRALHRSEMSKPSWPISPASRRLRARRWATPVRSSRARRERRRRRKPRSRPQASGSERRRPKSQSSRPRPPAASSA